MGVPARAKARIRAIGCRELDWQGMAVGIAKYIAPNPCSRCANPAVAKSLTVGGKVLVCVVKVPIKGQCCVCLINLEMLRGGAGRDWGGGEENIAFV